MRFESYVRRVALFECSTRLEYKIMQKASYVSTLLS